jgi:DNA-binding winged helix-turn-helix (wHTH) protein
VPCPANGTIARRAGGSPRESPGKSQFPQTTVRVRFGPFTVDTETRQLLREASALHLSTKAFDLLAALVEHRPKVLDKSALQARLWPDTYVVDGNLNVLVAEIRRALGDDAREPTFIRTVHGVGYAFCGAAIEGAGAQRTIRSMPCWFEVDRRTYRLSDGASIVGRDPDCEVWLDSPSVSRRHARVTVDADDRRVWLEDLHSKNGTRKGKVAVRGRVELLDGDLITFGSVDATLHSWNAETAAETKRIRRKRNAEHVDRADRK